MLHWVVPMHSLWIAYWKLIIKKTGLPLQLAGQPFRDYRECMAFRKQRQRQKTAS